MSAAQHRLQDIDLNLPLREARAAFLRAYFSHHLAETNGSVRRTAERAGLERTHMYRAFAQCGLPLRGAK